MECDRTGYTWGLADSSGGYHRKTRKGPSERRTYDSGVLASDSSDIPTMGHPEYEGPSRLASNENSGIQNLAGKKAIAETALSRFFLPLPVLFFPAIGTWALTYITLMPRNIYAANVIELTLCLCSLCFALPMSISLFK